VIGTRAGVHRLAWDLHHERPVAECTLPISATPRNTACEPEGPWVAPGRYTVRLVVTPAGTGEAARPLVLEQPVVVRMDPRVTTPALALRQQHELSMALYDAWRAAGRRLVAFRALRAQLVQLRGDAAADELVTLDGLAASVDSLSGDARGVRPGTASYATFVAQAQSALDALQGSDAPPTRAMVAAARDRLATFRALEARRQRLVSVQLPAVNERLRGRRLVVDAGT
jgi:hypothetical protein